MTNQKVQLKVLSPTSKVETRLPLFKSLFEDTEYDLVEGDESKPDFVVYFDTDLVTGNPDNGEDSVIELAKFKEETTCKSIIDVTEDYFRHERLGAILTLCVVCANFVTCSDAEMQETIYLNTGRLAQIVNTPILETSFKSPDCDLKINTTNPEIVWFGPPSEIFSIRKDQVKFKQSFDIQAVQVDGTQKSHQELQDKLETCDVVYFPETFTQEGETDREGRVLFCILEGKFVCAPNNSLESDFQDSLEEALAYIRTNGVTSWVQERQDEIRETNSKDSSQKQLLKAFTLIDDEDFKFDLDYYLENEEINF